MTRARSRVSPLFAALFVASASSACGLPQPVARVATKTTQPAVTPSMPVAIANAGRPVREEHWSLTYERRCLGSITSPAISPSGKSLAFCEALYDASSGVFQRKLPIGVRAFVTDSDVYRDDYQGGAAIFSVSTQKERINVTNDLDDTVATSPRGDTILTQQMRPMPRGFIGNDAVLTLRNAASLEVIRKATFKGSDDSTVGFLSDGTPLTFTKQPCKTINISADSTRTVCPDAALYALRGTQLIHGAPIFDGAKAVGFAADGRRAALIDGSGLAHVVNLPAGDGVLDIPMPRAEDDERIIAVSNDGEHVALTTPSHVVVLEHRLASFVVVYEGSPWPDGLPPKTLQFAPNGQALYVANGYFMQVIGVEPSAKRPIAPTITVKPPKGYKPSTEESAPETSPEGTLSKIGDWHSKSGASFKLYREDAAEMDPNLDADAWGKVIIERFSSWAVTDASQNEKELHRRAWKSAAGRNLEFETHFTGGCEPADVYYRFAERGGILYRGELSLPMFKRPKRKALNRLFDAFFDKPLGAAEHDILRIADLPKPPDGPC